MSHPDPVPGVLVAPCPCGSGKRFCDCHGSAPMAALMPPGTLQDARDYIYAGRAEVAPPPVTRKLDIAAGQNCREGFESVDIWPGASHVVDLQRYPWPFEDASVLELNCSHYIEHIPMEMVDSEGVISSGAGSRDALFRFFDECWRILVPDGWLHVQWPSHRSDRAFQDPTHRRFPTPQTMLYMNEEWRRINKLDHYNVACNFSCNVDPVVDIALTLKHPEVAQATMQHHWNTIIDWTAKLQKKPRLPPR